MSNGVPGTGVRLKFAGGAAPDFFGGLPAFLGVRSGVIGSGSTGPGRPGPGPGRVAVFGRVMPGDGVFGRLVLGPTDLPPPLPDDGAEAVGLSSIDRSR